MLIDLLRRSFLEFERFFDQEVLEQFEGCGVLVKRCVFRVFKLYSVGEMSQESKEFEHNLRKLVLFLLNQFVYLFQCSDYHI